MPTTALAATTLCTQNMFPAPAPINCAAETMFTSVDVSIATLYWIGEKVNVDTVALPVIKEPSSPKNGAINTQIPPKLVAKICGMLLGILGKSLTFNPEFVNT